MVVIIIVSSQTDLFRVTFNNFECKNKTECIRKTTKSVQKYLYTHTLTHIDIEGKQPNTLIHL